MAEEGDEIGESSLVEVEVDGELDRMAATKDSLPQTVNLEWGKAVCSKESIEKLAADGVFSPGELVEWRAPAKDETPAPSTMEDQFVVLSLTHIMCGLRVDASDFLISLLAHYGIEWSHLTPNSITALSIFAHLCEAYMGVPPTVEVFAHFYRLYHNMKGETTTLGGIYFRLKDKMRRTYPIYCLRTSQFMWNCMWFYAKVPQSCRLTFRGDALMEASNWKDQLPLSPEQEKQVRRIAELSNQGLTGVDIVRDYLKHRISPLRRRVHLACEYTGPADPIRDSNKELSVEDIESKISYLLDLKKIAMIQPPIKCSVPTSMVGASAHVQANQRLGLQDVLSTRKAKDKAVDNVTASRRIRKHSMTAYKPLGSASLRRYTRQSAGHRKTVVPPLLEIDSSPTQCHSNPQEDILEGTHIAAAPFPNPGMVQESIERPAEVEEGERAELVKPIVSIIHAKRKSVSSLSGSQRKAKYSLLSIVTKTRMPSLGSGSIKGTSSTKEAVATLNSQPQGLAQPSPVSSVGEPENSALIILANVVDQSKVVEDSMSNVLLDQPVRSSPPKEVNPVQSISEGVKGKETIKEPTLVPEEINSEMIWEQMQKDHSDYVTLSAAASSNLLEQAKKLVVENKRVKGGQIILEQQVKNLEEKTRLLTESKKKDEQEALKRIAENTRLKDENRGQRQMIDELCKQNESIQEDLAQKCTEVNRLKEEVAKLIKEKEELQARVSRVNELLQLMTNTLGHTKDIENRAS